MWGGVGWVRQGGQWLGWVLLGWEGVILGSVEWADLN